MMTSNTLTVTTLRQSTLQSLGLGTVLEIFQNGQLPLQTAQLVDEVFGPEGNRGAMVISGACGIVGAGKVMQFASRLQAYGIPIIALDLPGAPDGLTQQYKGLQASFGPKAAADIMQHVVRINYDGSSLPATLHKYNPRFLLEAIPENLSLKKAHYELFRKTYPGIHIWSVTSGFPSSELGVGIAHPAFPHEINKIFEIVEDSPSPQTRLLWSLGLIPLKVSDNWSFVLDVFFCGLLQACLHFCHRTNTPYWKVDKYIRKILGPNPFRAHDVIGAKGANFLTWSCLHHLSVYYGALYKPENQLEVRKESGQNWYPLNHFRPLVNWSLDAETETELNTIVLGALYQMTSLMVHENRAQPAVMNLIGEVCAQFTRGILAHCRQEGAQGVRQQVAAFHKLLPQAAQSPWYPAVFDQMDTPEWLQLYVNAEHNGVVGTITIARESYNRDVDAELNRAIDWLRDQGIKRVIVTGDFHLSTQMVGADTNEFFPAILQAQEGIRIAATWSATARRLHADFEVSVGFVHGKRCMGGMLELLMHCHYLIAPSTVSFAMPEVTLPVLPGMEGCHWPLRKCPEALRPKLLHMLLSGQAVKASQAVGWLIDVSGTLDECLAKAWEIANNGANALAARPFEEAGFAIRAIEGAGLESTSDPALQGAREAIAACIEAACGASLAQALPLQAKYSGEFMTTQLCRKGRVGSERDKIMNV